MSERQQNGSSEQVVYSVRLRSYYEPGAHSSGRVCLLPRLEDLSTSGDLHLFKSS